MSTVDVALAAQTMLQTSSPAPEVWRAQHFSTWMPLASLVAAKKDSTRTHVAIVLDIEGTTTPLPFVTKVLYPASETYLHAFLERSYPQDADVVNCVREASQVDAKVKETLMGDNVEHIRRSFESHLHNLIAANSKASYLKVIQGKIWKALYERGEIKGHLFEDAAIAVQHWSSRNHPWMTSQGTDIFSSVWIYSSGSIAAQQLLLKYSSHGDLSRCISGNFDPRSVGGKMEVTSYQNIRQRIVRSLGDTVTDDEHLVFVFLTDSLGEIAAARASQKVDAVVLLTRPMNAVMDEQSLRSALEGGASKSIVGCVCSFEQLQDTEKVVTMSDDDVTSRIGSLVKQVQPYQTPQANTKLKSFL